MGSDIPKLVQRGLRTSFTTSENAYGNGRGCWEAAHGAHGIGRLSTTGRGTMRGCGKCWLSKTITSSASLDSCS